MAKTSGLGGIIAIDDASGTPRTITNDIADYQIATPRGVQDVTGVDKSANERLLLLADASCTVNGIFNSAANNSHDVFKTVPSTSVARTTSFKPIGGSTPVLAFEALFTDYQINRSAAGELPWSAPGVLADGSVPTWALCLRRIARARNAVLTSRSPSSIRTRPITMATCVSARRVKAKCDASVTMPHQSARGNWRTNGQRPIVIGSTRARATAG